MSSLNLIDRRLEELFRKTENNEYRLFTLIGLIIYSYQNKFSSSDLYMLAKLIEEKDSAKDYFTKLVNYYDGDVLKLPPKDELRYNQMLAITWYLKDFKGWSWEQIKVFMSLPKYFEDEFFSSISFGKKISSRKDEINKELLLVLQKGNFPNLKQTIQEVLENGK